MLAQVGRIEEARALVRQVVTEWQIGVDEDGRLHVFALTNLFEAAVMVEDRRTVRELSGRVNSLLPMSVAFGTPVAMTCPARLLGAAAKLLNEPEKSRGYYRQALELSAKIRFRPEIALTRLQLAELLLEHYPDERAEALDHLDFAIAEFRDMKMQPSLERALRHRGLLNA
jgi:hypothetical protein